MSYASEVLTDQPKAYYRLNETGATDDFNRSDTSAPDLGSNWTNVGGPTFGVSFHILSNTVQTGDLSTDQVMRYTAASFAADQYSECKVTVAGTASQSGFGPVVRCVADTCYRVVVCKAATNNVVLAKFVAGTYTSLGSRTATWVDGDVLRLEAAGTTLRIYQNGTQLGADFTDSSIASGAPGISYSSLVTSGSIDDWKGGGFPQDSSGYANHMTVVGGTPTYGVASPILNNPNDTAITLNSAPYFSTEANASTDTGDVFSLEAWANTVGTGAEQLIVNRSNQGWAMGLNSDGTLYIAQQGIAAIASSRIIVTATRWHHCVVTKNGSSVHVYVDGVDVTGTVTNLTIPTDPNDTLKIGAEYNSPSTGTFFNGSLDEVAVYDHVLSPARVLTHYRAATITFRFDYSQFPKTFLLGRPRS